MKLFNLKRKIAVNTNDYNISLCDYKMFLTDDELFIIQNALFNYYIENYTLKDKYDKNLLIIINILREVLYKCNV